MNKKLFAVFGAAAFVALLGASCGGGGPAGPGESAKGEDGAGGEKGISFDDFRSKLKSEAAAWAGGEYYIVSVGNRAITSNIFRIDSHNGIASAWEGNVVKCESFKEAGKWDPSDRPICRGKKRIITVYVDSKGETKTSTEDDTFDFYGSEIFKDDDVKIGAGEAESKANATKNFSPIGFEDYVAELKFNDKAGAPVWTIGKSCTSKGEAEEKCRQEDHWSVKINASSGEIIK